MVQDYCSPTLCSAVRSCAAVGASTVCCNKVALLWHTMCMCCISVLLHCALILLDSVQQRFIDERIY